MVSTSQFYTNLITEFLKPSGALSEKLQLNTDTNRSLLNANITKSFNINTIGKVEIELNGVITLPGKNLFRQDCFEFNCFEEEGIFTYIRDISDICLVDSNKFLTKEEREEIGASCYLDDNSNPTFFVRGTPDKEGNVYVADIGIINSTSGSFSIINKNTPFYFNDKKNSLSALSLSRIPKGIKCARIKRINKTSIKEIGLIYGELDNQFYFPHTTLEFSREFTAKKQSINLENLSINLLLLTSFKQYESKENQIIYRNFNFSSPEIESIVNKSSTTLTNLILTEEFPQEGSIPFHISSYSSNETEYNSFADLQYTDKIKNCFDKDCFDTNCFETIINNSLINRSIDNRSIAWTIQYLTSYSINYSVDLTFTIISLAQYLLNQKDRTTKLFYKGWDQKEPIITCEKIISEVDSFIISEIGNTICSEGTEEELLQDNTILNYSNSLTLNKEIITSTNIAIFISLLKTFEITQDFTYLIEADNLYQSINKYLINNEGLFKHSINESKTSLDSATYNLILYLILEDYKNIEVLVEFFKIRLTALPAQNNEEVFVGTSLVSVGIDNVELPPLELLTSDDDFNLFTPTSIDNINTIDDISKYNYLIASSLLYLNTKIFIPFTNLIQNKSNIIKNKIEEYRDKGTLIFAVSSLIDNNSFINIDTIKFNSLFEFNNYQFQKTLTLNNLLLNTPKEYGWFNINKINRNSTLGNIYYAIAQALAKNISEYESIKKNASIDNMYGIILNKKAEEYKLTRFIKESDLDLRNRIKTEIYTRGINKNTIEQRARLFNSPTIIKDNYETILAYENNNLGQYSFNWGEGYLQGDTNHNTNIATFNFNQPVEEDVYKEIYKFKPVGTRIRIRETLTFSISKQSTLINISNLSDECPRFLLENGEGIRLENEDLLCII